MFNPTAYLIDGFVQQVQRACGLEYLEPTDLHQHVSLFIGSEEEVVLAEQFLQGQR